MHAPSSLKLPHGVLDLNAGEVRTDEGTTALTEREVTLLRCLAATPNELVNSQTLLDLFDLKPAGRSPLINWVKRLRSKIEPDPKKPTVLLRKYGGKIVLHLDTSAPTDPMADRLESPLFGRDSGLEQLHHLLKEGHRVLTLVGPAGVGKTRLAGTLAQDVKASNSFLGGVLFCSLNACESVTDVLRLLMSTLGLPLPKTPSLYGSIELLGRALSQRGRTLWVLDNLEHLVTELHEPLTALFRLSPGVQWVLTSRHRVGVHAEQLVPVGPLQTADGVALLTHRVHALGGAVPKGASQDLERLVVALDGLPLAILVAAARLSVGSWSAVVASLKDSLMDLMEGEDSLQRTLEWSWNLLDEVERSALIQCAVFRGGFTMELAEEVVVVEDHWPEDLMMALVDHSLLWVNPEEPTPRLDMYESVRAFVAQRHRAPSVEVGKRLIQAIGQRSQGVFNPHLTDRERHLRLGWMRAYEGNLQVAEALAQVDDGEAAYWVWRCYAWLLSHEGRVEDRETLLKRWQHRAGLSTEHERALQGARLNHCIDIGATAEASELAQGLLEAGGEWVLDGLQFYLRTDQVQRFLEESAAVLSGLETPHRRARLLFSRGDAFFRLGQIRDAEASYEEALEWPYAAWWKNGARNMLAACQLHRGEHQGALAQFEACAEYDAQYGTRLHRILSLKNLGRARLILGQTSAAREALDQAWTLSKVVTHHPIGQDGICHRAVMHLVDGELELAGVLIDQLGEGVRSQADVLSLRAALGALAGDVEEFASKWSAAKPHALAQWALHEEEIDALGRAYRSVASVSSESRGDACATIREVVSQPVIRLNRGLDEMRHGSPDHDFHVLILQAWVRRQQSAADCQKLD